MSQEAEVMLCLLDGMRELRAIVVDAIIVLSEITCHYFLVEEGLAFFLVRLTDQVFIWHGEDCLENVQHSTSKLLHAVAQKCTKGSDPTVHNKRKM